MESPRHAVKSFARSIPPHSARPRVAETTDAKNGFEGMCVAYSFPLHEFTAPLAPPRTAFTVFCAVAFNGTIATATWRKDIAPTGTVAHWAIRIRLSHHASPYAYQSPSGYLSVTQLTRRFPHLQRRESPSQPAQGSSQFWPAKLMNSPSLGFAAAIASSSVL